MTRVCIIILALLAAACADGAPPANRQQPKGNPFQDRLAAMPEGQRNAVFIRAIRDSGQECQHVESSATGADVSGIPTWRARCEGGRSYTIAILPGGVAQVVDDAEARLVGDNQAAGNRSGDR
jgi:hypothetical protein